MGNTATDDTTTTDVETTALRAWRLERGFSLSDLSGLTGLSVSLLSRVERRRRQLRPETKVLVARRLGASVGALFPVGEERHEGTS